MAKKLLALALCFALCTALVGCAGGDEDGFVEEETEEVVVTKKEKKEKMEKTDKSDLYADTSAWKDITMRVAGYRNFDGDPLNYEFVVGAQEFTDDFGTKVTFQQGGKDGQGEDLAAAIVSGDPWEVQLAYGISVFPMVFAENLYQPIDEYINYETNDKIDEITVEGATWLGKHYGISSLPMQEMWYLAYNETWMKELGIKTPHEYYEEGAWTLDAYKEVNAAAVAFGANSRSAVSRPHTGSRYMSEWNAETGEVTIVYDQPDNVSWLSFWGDLLTDTQYNIAGGGCVATRDVIMRDEVMPNLIKDEASKTTTDVIRYIHFPNPDGKLGTYLTDSHFLFPNAVAKEKLPCAVALASYMTDAKSRYVMEDTYVPNMTEEDLALFEENMNNAYFLPRIFYYGVFDIGNKFRNDMAAGKSVATHIEENVTSLKQKADAFNLQYSIQ